MDPSINSSLDSSNGDLPPPPPSLPALTTTHSANSRFLNDDFIFDDDDSDNESNNDDEEDRVIFPNPPNISDFTPLQFAFYYNKIIHNHHMLITSATNSSTQPSVVLIRNNLENQMKILHDITNSILQNFQQISSSSSSNEAMFHLIPLSFIQSNSIVNEFFCIICDKIKFDTHLDIEKLKAISQIVYYGGRLLNTNMILNTLTIIADKIPLIRVKDEILILHTLESLSSLLNAILSLDLIIGTIPVDSLQGVLDALDGIKSTIQIKTSTTGTALSRIIGIQIEYAKQALIRITLQKSETDKLFSVSYSLVKGVIKGAFAIANRNPMEVIDAIILTYTSITALSAIYKEKKQEEWFAHVRVMNILCFQSFSDFRDYYHLLFKQFSEPTAAASSASSSPSSSSSSAVPVPVPITSSRFFSSILNQPAAKIDILISIITLINKVVCNREMSQTMTYEESGGSSVKSIREVAILDLAHIYCNTALYGTDFEVRSLIIDHLWQYCSIPEKDLQLAAIQSLTTIIQFIDEDMINFPQEASNTSLTQRWTHMGRRNVNPAIGTHPMRIWLNDRDVRSKSADADHRFPYINSNYQTSTSSPTSSITYVHDAMESKYPILYLFESMRKKSYELCNSKSSILKSDLATYVPLSCSVGPRDDEVHSLFQKTYDFIHSDSHQRVLLLHGNAGSGKSLFGRWFESRLWENFIQGDSRKAIPIFISLAALKDPTRNAITERLKQEGFTQRQIDRLRDDCPYRLVFILDGFDEIQGKQNIYEGNNFNEWRNIKVIITSRSEYLFGLGNYLSYFDSNSNLKEYYIRPFSTQQRQEFYEKLVREGESVWKNHEIYEKTLHKSGLNELVNTPFMLRIITTILPSLIGSGEGSDGGNGSGGGGGSGVGNGDDDDGDESNALMRQTSTLTRSLVFETFTELEFLKCREKLRKDPTGRVVIPEDFDEIESFRKYSMHLAAEMFISSVNSITIRGSDYRFPDEKEDHWDYFFSNSNITIKLSRYGSPLSCVGRQRSFRHKSLQEYFAAKMLLRELSLSKEMSQGYLTAAIPITEASYLNKRYLFEETSIQDFFLEMMRNSQECSWNDLLLEVVESSKTNPNLAIACGNAITLLLLLGYSFEGKDLQKIHASGAVFDHGNFRGVDFRDAVFKDCSWDGTNLDECNFNDSDFTFKNLIEERSNLRDSSSSRITAMANVNEKGVVLSSSVNGTSIWTKGSFIQRYETIKNCEIYLSSNDKWIFMAGNGVGYLFHISNLLIPCLRIENLNENRNAISLTNETLFFGVVNETRGRIIDLFHLPLDSTLILSHHQTNTATTTSTLSAATSQPPPPPTTKIFQEFLDPYQDLHVIKVNHSLEIKELTLVRQNHHNKNLLFVSFKDKRSYENCIVFQFQRENQSYRSPNPTNLTLLSAEWIPKSSYLFTTSTNHLPVIYDLTNTNFKKCEVEFSQNIPVYECCFSSDGCSMLLGNLKEGYLFTIQREETTKSSSLIFTKLLQLDGMIGPFSTRQFSVDSQLVAVLYPSEVRVMKIKGWICMQTVPLRTQIERAYFNLNDQELLILEKNSNKILRRRVDLKEDVLVSGSGTGSGSGGNIFELSCVGSSFFNTKGLTSEDISLFSERGGLLRSENELISLYSSLASSSSSSTTTSTSLSSSPSSSDFKEMDDLLFEAFRSRYESFIHQLSPHHRHGLVGRCLTHYVVSHEYFDGTYGNYLLFLKNQGFSLDEKKDNGDTILMELSRKGHSKTIQKLFEEWKPDINDINNRGETALFQAAENGQLSVCQFLIDYHEANIHLPDQNGFTPLYIAAQNGHEHVCQLLVERNANIKTPCHRGRTPLSIAAQNGHASVFSLLLNQNKEVTSTNYTNLLFIASQNGHESVCEILLDKGALVNPDTSMSPLGEASQNGHRAVCSLLLRRGANVCFRNSKGATALFLAARHGHESICSLLLQSDQIQIDEMNDNGWTPLFAAALYGHETVCSLLIRHGAQINQQNEKGTTPLYAAAKNGHDSVCEVLLRAGADPNLAMNSGLFPLYIAAFNGHSTICSLLIDSGAEINRVIQNGTTPLFIATRNNYEAVKNLLIQCGADPNFPNTSPPPTPPSASHTPRSPFSPSSHPNSNSNPHSLLHTSSSVDLSSP